MKHTWRSLNDHITEMNEDEVLAMLTAERKGLRRVSMLQRLHQRYTALRTARERVEILSEANRP